MFKVNFSLTLSALVSVCRFFTKVGGEQGFPVCSSKGKRPLSHQTVSLSHLNVSLTHLISVLSGYEEDLQGFCKVPGVEEETQPGPEAMDFPRAEHAAVHQRVRADGAASRLSGEHRRERLERGEDAAE